MIYCAIEWRDAIYIQNHDLNDIVMKDLPLVRTIGELVHEDKKKIILRCHGDIGDDKDIKPDDGSDFMIIPKTWVEKKIILVEKVE